MAEHTYLPLSFPRCPSCNESWTTCSHRHCGGELEMSIDSNDVRCARCRHAWHIWESRFYCRCSHQFAATDVDDAINELIDLCTRLRSAFNAAVRDETARRQVSSASFRGYLAEFCKGLGSALGYALTRVASLLFP